ncbi:MAG: class I SAM-dependent methyltransferase [Deltaproteobacteria bacterium]|nr:class I SAM-dependent methyltransferase [Deltaproteobacteria bacterium]
MTELSIPERTEMAPPGTADMVLTFRNVHNWMKGDYAPAMFEAMFAALKPRGVLGVVEHRAPKGASRAQMVQSGYVTEAHVKRLARDAGFRLVERSEINANPKDTANHPAGVWTLPPTLRLGEKDRAKFVEIGESDRMTLRFIKPARK